MSDLLRCDVRDATHVKVDGVVDEIASKWGVSDDGGLAKPSQGGFGVVLKDGRRVDMWSAHSYWRNPV